MADPADQPDESDGASPGEEIEKEEADPELIALAEERQSGSALQPILFLVVIGFGCWILADFWPDLAYFFSTHTPSELGSVHRNYARSADEAPQKKLDLPHNRYVALSGIPKRRSQSKGYRFFRLVGAPIYVQTERKNPDQSLADRVGKEGEASVDREYFEGKGRLIAMWKMPERFQSIKAYYRKHYGTRFCGNVPPEERDEIRQRQRAALIENHRKKYENASEKERKRQDLSPRPSEEKIQEVLQSNPVCIHAYLMLDGKSPGSSWRILLLAGLFGIFIVLNIYWLIRWVRRFFGSPVDPEALEEA